MLKKDVVGLSLQDLNTFSAHRAHQADVSAAKKIANATGSTCPVGYDDDEDMPTTNQADEAVIIASLAQ